ncbi:Uncharacterised protein [Mycobacteroides abscessus subsp. bolletii]|uniref:phage holin n=1 Tax=Mycobacteroides abscessus TaxID=36809 RepID=UPI00092A18EC|nr:hypothetical protein [Mycobacteroides abscessus]MDM2133667.1 hypothetical protein [Mycobacteroides abscessus]MDM2142601.1 hypothetical protein [Mycobacteroides abscessus]MDM2153793.1 hypothetical protein [Mycobacteroides abscessus]SHX91407.1 Uncharacterised protein [Mycobacteroides abscessus subsp. bolletii]SKP83512.1 Uncharacterised protein [Mycobacteroides abscessus subsp. bolletii]
MIKSVLLRIWAAIKVFASERLGVRTWEDARNLAHIVSPYLVTALVSWNLLAEDHAKLIVALVLSVLSPALAFFNTRDGFRRWVYGILPPLQALIVGFGWFTDNQVTPLMTIVVALLGGLLASTNTPTSVGPNDRRTP